MKRPAHVLLAASLLAAFSASSSATDFGPIDGLAEELDSRWYDENYGVDERFGKAVMFVAGLQLGNGEFYDNTSPGFVRALPGYVRRMYPAEFAKNTPGDISDLVDAYKPAAADAWRDLLLARADELEALVARSVGCGYHAKASGLAKLLALVAKTRRAIPRADAARTPAARFAKMLAIRLIDATAAVRRGLAPPDPAEWSECSARVAGSRLDGYEPEDDPSSLDGAHLALHVTFERSRAHGAFMREYWDYDLRIETDGVVDAGTYSVSSASLYASHGLYDYDTEDWTDLGSAEYALAGGTIVVADFCDTRILGTFGVRLRDVANGAALTVDKGKFELPLQ